MASTSCSKTTLQELDVREFLPAAAECLQWNGLIGDTVMDIGCGTGSNSTKHLVTLFPDVGNVIGIDLSQSTISMANRMNQHPKIEFCVADIEDRSTLTLWMGKMSKVLSVNCFNFLTDQTIAFDNVYRLLAPGGNAAIFFSLQSSYFDAFVEITALPRWKGYFQKIGTVIPASHSKKLDASHYQPILENIGFTVVACKDELKSYIYPSDAECRRSITSCGMADLIPIEQREEFREDIFTTFLKHNPKNSNGQPCLKYRALSMFVKKQVETPMDPLGSVHCQNSSYCLF